MLKIELTVDIQDEQALSEAITTLKRIHNARWPDAIPGTAEVATDPAVEHAIATAPAAPVAPLTIVPKTYDVDGRRYTAEQIRASDWSAGDLLTKGWSVAQVAEVLNIPIDDVVAENAPLTADDQVEETTAGGVELDSRGLPWDARIHAGTKTKIADGSWKMKRGVDADVVEQVDAELTNLMEIPVTHHVSTTSVSAEPVVIAPPSGVVIPPPVAKPVEVADADADAMTFAEFLKACSAKMTAGETNMQRILAVANAKGIASLQLVNSRLDLIPELWAEISTHQKVAQ